MNRGIYVTARGMIGAERQLDVIAHNLANVSTSGFRSDGIDFSDVMMRNLGANGGYGANLGPVGFGGTKETEHVDFSQGTMTETGNPLDVAIEGGNGMFAIQTEAGVRYTRSGQFERSLDGKLVDAQGRSVLDETLRPINLPEGKITVEDDGSVLVDGTSQSQIGIFRGTFEKSLDGMFVSSDAKQDPDIQMRSGYLEQSNVNVMEMMVEMIKLSRTFEMAQRSIMSQDELTQKLIQSLQNS